MAPQRWVDLQLIDIVIDSRAPASGGRRSNI
jgi:hypothetical protein